MRERDEREAVFWCGLLRPVLFGEIPRGAVLSFLRKLAAREVTFPDGRKGKPSVSTLKRKLRLYRKGGFGALPRKRRADKGSVRAVPPEVVRSATDLKRELPERSVDKTFSDVRLKNRLYRVDPKYRGERVEVRYDPFGDGQKVFLYSLDGQYLGQGTLHHREHGHAPTPVSPPTAHTSLVDVLIDRQLRLQRQERGIDFNGALRSKRRPFSRFAACLADLLGRRGGLSAFDAEEIQVLRQIHERFPALTRARLKQAVSTAHNRTLTAIVLALQELNRNEKE